MEDENQDAVLNGIGVCAGNGVIPERRHSSTEGSRSSRGEVRVTVNRRHSLPGAARSRRLATAPAGVRSGSQPSTTACSSFSKSLYRMNAIREDRSSI